MRGKVSKCFCHPAEYPEDVKNTQGYILRLAGMSEPAHPWLSFRGKRNG